MSGLRAIWRGLRAGYDDLFLLMGIGLIGSLLSLAVLPIPFVLAAHSATAVRLIDGRMIRWHEWFDLGREHSRFFYLWAVVVAIVVLLLGLNLYYYNQSGGPWATILQPFFVGLLAIWLAFQPFVPFCYFAQTDRRLHIALRNAAAIAFSAPLSTLVLWGFLLLIVGLLAIYAWPILLLMPPFLILIIAHFVHLRIVQITGVG